MSATRLPYPGLRPFARDESDLFFGREGCVDDMIDRLAETRFLAVLGASGSGKSSLVVTGLLDALELGLYAKAGSRWSFVTMRPGGHPIHALAAALLVEKSRRDTVDGVVQDSEVDLLSAFLRRGPRSLVEWCRAGNLREGTNLLLLVDQFEELFRYGDYAGREQAEAFATLLMESTRSDAVSIHVVITMRSEYLGACALMPGLAECINAGIYLTPRMTRDQIEQAIEGPAGVCGFSIEPALVNRLLNDLSTFAPWADDHSDDQLQRLSRRADQLPLMQHVLNRMWLLANAQSKGDPVVLKLEEYLAVGGLKGALDIHTSEIVRSLDAQDRPLVEKVFRALIAGPSISSAVRRPCRLTELVRLAGGDRPAVERVIDAFRGKDCNFLMPPAEVPLSEDTIIDISHESLIRQWSQLSGWMDKEARAAATWRRLHMSAESHANGEGGLLGPLDLANAESWWHREPPNEAWAQRYGDQYELVKSYLAASQAKSESDKNAEVARDREIRKARRSVVLAGAGVAVAVIVALVHQLWTARTQAQEAEKAKSQIESQLSGEKRGSEHLAGVIESLCSSDNSGFCQSSRFQDALKSLKTHAASLDIQTERMRKKSARDMPDLAAELKALQTNSTTDSNLTKLGNLAAQAHGMATPAQTVGAQFTPTISPICRQPAAQLKVSSLTLAEADAKFESARTKARDVSSVLGITELEGLYGWLSKQHPEPLPNPVGVRYVKVASLLTGLYSDMGCSERARNTIATVASLVPAPGDDVSRAPVGTLDAYGWYLSYAEGFVPWDQSTRYRWDIRSRFLQVAKFLVQSTPKDAEAQYSLSLGYLYLRHTYDALSMAPQAADADKSMIEAAIRAHALDPNSPHYTLGLGEAYSDEAQFFMNGGKLPAAEKSARTALQFMDEIVQSGDAARLTRSKSDLLDTLSLILGYRKDWAGAAQAAVQAVNLAVDQSERDPLNDQIAIDAIPRIGNLSWVLAKLPDKTSARDACLNVARRGFRLLQKRPVRAGHIRLFAAALDCAIDAEGAIPSTIDDHAVDTFLVSNDAEILTAFRDFRVNPADDPEYYERMTGGLQRLQARHAEKGELKRATQLAQTIIDVLSQLRPKLDYDIYTMARISKAYLALGDYSSKVRDYRGAAEKYRICADPDRVPYPDKNCMRRLAALITAAKLGPGHLGELNTMRGLIPKYDLESFTVPLRVNPGAEPVSFKVYVTTPPKPFLGVDNQVQWLKLAKGEEIPADIADSFRKIDKIARENNVSFPALAKYALGANGSGGKSKELDSIRQRFKDGDSAGALGAARDLYRDASKRTGSESWEIRGAVADTLSAAFDQSVDREERATDVTIFVVLKDLTKNDLGNPFATRVRRSFAHVLEKLSGLISSNNPNAAKALLQQAIALREAATRDDPGDAGCDCETAMAYHSLASVAITLKDYGLAEQAFEKASDLRRGLVVREPETLNWRRLLVESLRSLSLVRRVNKSPFVLASIREATDVAFGSYIASGEKEDADTYFDTLKDLSSIAEGEGAFKLAFVASRNGANVMAALERADPKRKADLVDALGDLSWHALFVRDWRTVEAAADKALFLDKNQTWIEMNAAHAHLFTGEIEEAERVYYGHACSKLTINQGASWKSTLAEDFAKFRKVKLPLPTVASQILATVSSTRCPLEKK